MQSMFDSVIADDCVTTVAAGLKKATFAFLVSGCGGQEKRQFPHKSPETSVEVYNSRLKVWLYEKAR